MLLNINILQKINNLGFKFKLNSQQAIDKTINNIK